MIFPGNYLEMITWININVCFPLTFLVIPLCFMVRLAHIPVSYYINLLISNLIPIITLIYFLRGFNYSLSYFPHPTSVFSPYFYGGVGSVCFRMIFAVERFLFLYRPQFHFIRERKDIICVLAWILCLVLYIFEIHFDNYYARILCVLFTAIMFIICLAVTLKSLCVATSEPPEEKYRVVGALVLLLVNYILIILPMIVYFIRPNPNLFDSTINIFFTLSLHSPLMDFLLLGFMSKGPFLRLLMCLCCCRKRNPAVNDSNRSAV